MKRFGTIAFVLLCLILVSSLFGCSSKETVELKSTDEATLTPSPTAVATPTATPSPVPTPSPSPEPELLVEEDYEYYLENDGAVISKYYGWRLVEPIPDTLGGYPVVGIGNEAFAGTEKYCISIPKTVTSIGDRAFADSYDIEIEVVLPDSVTTIGEEAFCLNGLKSITLSKNISYMGDRVCCNCHHLEKIIIPEGVTYIGKEAFANLYNQWFSEGAELQAITIPSTVEYIGENAFTQFDYELEIKMSAENRAFRLEDRTLLSIDGTILYEAYFDESRVEKVEEADWFYYYVLDGTYIVPEGVVTIKEGAFNNPCYDTVVIPASVTSIEEGAFSYNMTNGFWRYKPNIVGLGVNKNYKEIDNVLMNKEGTQLIRFLGDAEKYTVPNTVKRIGAFAFYADSDLLSLDIPSSVTSIGEGAFRWSELKSIEIPDSVIEIGNDAFSDITDLTIYTTEGSYASQYAAERGIPCVIS